MDIRNILRRAFIGLLLIGIGLLLLGFNMNFIPNEWRCYIFTPKILLFIFGIVFITKRNHFFLGVVLFLFGILLYMPMFTNIQIDFAKVFLPLLFILGGISVITHRHSHRHFSKKNNWRQQQYYTESDNSKQDCWNNKNFEKSEIHENFIEDVLFFSGVEKIIDSNHFEGGKIVSFFGGLKINLTKADLAPGINNLEVVIGFGGCKLIVPSNWNVRVEAVSIFGGFVDKRVIISSNDSDKILIIKGITIFGGGEITSI